jgi:hypothetical protein
MNTSPYKSGYQNALNSLGLTKIAVSVTQAGAAMPLARRAGQWLKAKLPAFGRSLKEMTIGSPLEFGREIVEGKALAPRSLIRQSFHTPGMLNKLLWYGIPAYQAAGILQSQEPNKAERMGGMLGGTVLGMGAFRPLGLAGSMALGTLGERVGEGVVRAGKSFLPKPTPPQGQWQTPAGEIPAQQYIP